MYLAFYFRTYAIKLSWSRQALQSHAHSVHSLLSSTHRHLFLITSAPVLKCTPFSHSSPGLECGNRLLTCSAYFGG